MAELDCPVQPRLYAKLAAYSARPYFQGLPHREAACLFRPGPLTRTHLTGITSISGASAHVAQAVVNLMMQSTQPGSQQQQGCSVGGMGVVTCWSG
eukprot:scaffold204984_cov35-Tisochrysis_lutea.AAC.1